MDRLAELTTLRTVRDTKDERAKRAMAVHLGRLDAGREVSELGKRALDFAQFALRPENIGCGRDLERQADAARAVKAGRGVKKTG